MINFEKFAQRGNAYMNELTRELGHPDEKGSAGILLKAVLHTLRDRMPIPEGFHVMAQLPGFLKLIFVEEWKYLERPIQIKTVEEFTKEVENRQRKFGENQFDWQQSTEEIVRVVLRSLKAHISDGEYEHVVSLMPGGLQVLFEEPAKHE